MQYGNLDEASALCEALRELFVSVPGGSCSVDALERARALCEAAIAALDDSECRALLHSIQAQADKLYSDEAQREAALGALLGAEALRFRIFNALSALDGRLRRLQRPSRERS